MDVLHRIIYGKNHKYKVILCGLNWLILVILIMMGKLYFNGYYNNMDEKKLVIVIIAGMNWSSWWSNSSSMLENWSLFNYELCAFFCNFRGIWAHENGGNLDRAGSIPLRKSPNRTNRPLSSSPPQAILDRPKKASNLWAGSMPLNSSKIGESHQSDAQNLSPRLCLIRGSTCQLANGAWPQCCYFRGVRLITF